MAWAIFRVLVGRGLVDFLGTIQAVSEDEAMDQARLMFDWNPATESLEVEPDEESL